MAGGGVGVVAVGVVSDEAGGRGAGEGGAGSVSVAVAVGVGVPGGRVAGVVLVHGAVTVLVGAAIADLEGAWVDAVHGVVAVGAIRHRACGHRTGDRGRTGVAEAVSVGVRIPGGGVGRVVLVDAAVTVLVYAAFADLQGVGRDEGLAVITIEAIVHLSGQGLAGRHTGGRISVAVFVGVEVPGARVGGGVLVNGSVAVLVQHAVAGLGPVGIDQGPAIVAVLAGSEAVAVLVVPS